MRNPPKLPKTIAGILRWAKEMTTFVTALRVREGIGVWVQEMPDATVIGASSKSSRSSVISTPWGITTQADSENIQAICNPYSYLFKGAFDGTTETIANIEDGFTPDVGSYAWLEISQDETGTITAKEFNTGSWPGVFYTTDTDSNNTPFVNSFYLPLVKFVDPGDDAVNYVISIGSAASPTKLGVVQLCNQHQLLVPRQMGGVVGWATEAYAGIA